MTDPLHELDYALHSVGRTPPMKPPPEAISGDPLPAGDGARMEMLDMSRCKMFLYVDEQGQAIFQAGQGVSHAAAATAVRFVANDLEEKAGGSEVFRSKYFDLTLHRWEDSDYAEVLRAAQELTRGLLDWLREHAPDGSAPE